MAWKLMRTSAFAYVCNEAHNPFQGGKWYWQSVVLGAGALFSHFLCFLDLRGPGRATALPFHSGEQPQNLLCRSA